MKKVRLFLSSALVVASLFTLDSCKKNESTIESPSKKAIPKVDFSFASSEFIAPCDVLFENKTINALNYNWNFGDGTSSKEINPTKTFSVEGNYSVTLTATGEGGIDSITKRVLIKSRPSTAEFSTFTDPRDGQTYKTVKIGNQWWFAQNLNYQTSYGSFCYDNNSGNCAIYGRLYKNTAAALYACPPGWHLPSEAEWEQLINYLGGKLVAGGKMKNTTGWDKPNTGATNSSGFSALPGGYQAIVNHYFYGIGTVGGWWSYPTKDPSYSSSAYVRTLSYNNDYVYRDDIETDSYNGFSVRCVKN